MELGRARDVEGRVRGEAIKVRLTSGPQRRSSPFDDEIPRPSRSNDPLPRSDSVQRLRRIPLRQSSLRRRTSIERHADDSERGGMPPSPVASSLVDASQQCLPVGWRRPSWSTRRSARRCRRPCRRSRWRRRRARESAHQFGPRACRPQGRLAGVFRVARMQVGIDRAIVSEHCRAEGGNERLDSALVDRSASIRPTLSLARVVVRPDRARGVVEELAFIRPPPRGLRSSK